jgi:hypothetical protein
MIQEDRDNRAEGGVVGGLYPYLPQPQRHGVGGPKSAKPRQQERKRFHAMPYEPECQNTILPTGPKYRNINWIF